MTQQLQPGNESVLHTRTVRLRLVRMSIPDVDPQSGRFTSWFLHAKTPLELQVQCVTRDGVTLHRTEVFGTAVECRLKPGVSEHNYSDILDTVQDLIDFLWQQLATAKATGSDPVAALQQELTTIFQIREDRLAHVYDLKTDKYVVSDQPRMNAVMTLIQGCWHTECRSAPEDAAHNMSQPSAAQVLDCGLDAVLPIIKLLQDERAPLWRGPFQVLKELVPCGPSFLPNYDTMPLEQLRHVWLESLYKEPTMVRWYDDEDVMERRAQWEDECHAEEDFNASEDSTAQDVRRNQQEDDAEIDQMYINVRSWPKPYMGPLGCDLHFDQVLANYPGGAEIRKFMLASSADK